MAVMSFSLLIILFACLASGLWVGLALVLVAVTLLALFKNIPIDILVGQYTFNIMTSPELVALPLFIMMGEVLFRTKLSRSLFSGLAPWVESIPGRLLHVNVLGCAIFAAICGSSAATTQVVGRISLAELDRRGYARGPALGSLAGAGSLGFLIPPSTIMIVYGVLSNTSILRLFAAGVVPGILLAMTFMAWIVIQAKMHPEMVPSSADASDEPRLSRLAALGELLPVLLLILAVIGSMYAGIATPSEAAAVGVVGALVLSWYQGMLSWTALKEIALGAAQTSSLLGVIILGAAILGNVAGLLGIPRFIADYVAGLGLSDYVFIAALLVGYIILGTVLDGFSLLVMTLPVVLPLVSGAGFDLVWFGIFIVLVVEMAQITPPIGFNLFVIQGMTGMPLGTIVRAAFPYLVIMILFISVITMFPGIALWFPTWLMG